MTKSNSDNTKWKKNIKILFMDIHEKQLFAITVEGGPTK
jgi:hypothetical protein